MCSRSSIVLQIQRLPVQIPSNAHEVYLKLVWRTRGGALATRGVFSLFESLVNILRANPSEDSDKFLLRAVYN